jgi:hypothetical protein
LTYQDIISNDYLNDYIVVKSNIEANPEIKILNEEDLENRNLNLNNFEENFVLKMNKDFPLKNNFINYFPKNELNQNSIIKDNKNIKKKSSNYMEKQKPIQLIFLSQENQSILNNINIINNDFNI